MPFSPLGNQLLKGFPMARAIITRFEVMTAAEYDSLAVKSATTHYIIVG